MTVSRSFHTATLLQNGKVLVTGGFTDTFFGLFFDATATAEIYDPATGSWTATQPMQYARYFHTATLLSNGKVLVVGGGGGGSIPSELYDPVSGTWTNVAAPLADGFGNVAARLGNGNVLVAAGLGDNGTGTANSEVYDPGTGNWTLTGMMSTNFDFPVATLLSNGKVLVSGGAFASGSSISDVSPFTTLFDPGSTTWTAQGQLHFKRDYHTATLLPNGKVLVAGGNDLAAFVSPRDYLASAELYDPSTGNWTDTGSLNAGRSQHTSTLLSSGKVLVTGGETNGAGPDAELYDPSSGIWTPTSTMNVPARSGHTATLLPDGRVLIAGGYPGTNSELYLPTSGSVKVTISPANAISVGAQWQVDGGTFFDSGTVVSNLLGGSHTISFKNIFGWVTPSAQLITISDNATNMVSGTYIEKPGALQVNLSPAGVVSIGAQWSVDGGAFLNSGAVVTNLSAGSHSVAFKNIFGWMTPAAQLTSISDDVTNVVSGTYIEEPGAVQVNLNPSGAVSAGAQWQVDGGAFLNSGALATNLSAGSHTVAFKNITGWMTPSAQSTSISDGITNVVSGTYVPDPGALRVNLTPSGAVSAGAQWQVDGGSFQDSGAHLGNDSAGSHLISFKNDSRLGCACQSSDQY